MSTKYADRTGVFSNLITTIKAYIGVGILSIPYTFARSGLVMSIGMFLGVGILALHTMLLLIDSKHKVQKSKGVTVRSFSDLGRELFGNFGAYTIDVLLGLSQLAYSTAVIIFVTSNLSMISGWPAEFSVFDRKLVWTLITVPFFIWLALINDIKKLTPINLVALFIFSAGFIIILYFGMSYRMGLPADEFDIVLFNLDDLAWAETLSLAVYSFDLIAVVLPMEEAALDKQFFPVILSAGTWLASMLLILFGAIGYICFGEGVEPTILHNLDISVSQTMVLMVLKKGIIYGFTIGAFFGYPLSLWSLRQRIENILLKKPPPKGLMLNISDADYEEQNESAPFLPQKDIPIPELLRPQKHEEEGCCSPINIKRYLIRTGLVIGTAILGVGIPSFMIFISFIGASFGIALMLIAVYNEITIGHRKKSQYFILAKDLLIAIFGVGSMAVCSFVTIKNIADDCSSDNSQ